MIRTKSEIIKRINEVGTTRFCNGSCPSERVQRAEEIDKEKRLIPFVIISSENSTERYDLWEDEIYIEELDINGAKYDRLQTFFKDHKLVIDNAIGRVEKIRVEKDELKCSVQFGSDSDSEKIFQKYVDGILNDVSIGYIVNDIVVTAKKDEPTHILVTDFEIVELSAVWRGADAGAGVRSVKNKPLLDSKSSVAPTKGLKMASTKGRNIEFLQKKLNLRLGEINK